MHRTTPRSSALTSPARSGRPALALLATAAVLASLVVATPASATDDTTAPAEVAVATTTSEPTVEPAPATEVPAPLAESPAEVPAEPTPSSVPAPTEQAPEQETEPVAVPVADEGTGAEASDAVAPETPEQAPVDAAPAATPGPPSTTNNSLRCQYSGAHYLPNYFTSSTTWQGLCLTDGTVSDARTTTRGDAFDGFGYIQMADAASGWNYYVTAESADDYSFTRGLLTFTDRDVQIPNRLGTVDVIVSVKLVASWGTWRVQVVESGTDIPAPITFTFSGNLGSDGWTQWFTLDNGTYISNDNGASYDPVLIHTGGTDGTAELRTDGYDGVVADVTASTFEFTVGLLEYCSNSNDTLAVAAEIGTNIGEYINTDLAPVYESGCTVASLPLRQYAVEAPLDDTIEFTLAGTYDWSAGGTVQVQSPVPGLTFEAVRTGTPGVVPSIRVHGTPSALGHYSTWVTLTSHAGASYSAELRIIVAPKASAALSVAPLSLEQGVAGAHDLALSPSGDWDWSTGAEATVTGLPAGLTATVSGENVAGVIPTVRVSGVPHFNGSFTAHVTVSSFDRSVTTALPITVATLKGNLAIGFDVEIGEAIAGGPVGLYGSGLAAGSAWNATVRSTPIVIASGTVGADGQFAGTAILPSGLAAGWHSLTLSATTAGGAVERVLWFEVSAAGTLLSTSDSAPAPVAVPGVTALQVTGADPSPMVALGSLLLALGVAMGLAVRIRRRLATA